MADIKFSGLPVASALTGAELVPVVQGGVSKRTTTQDVANRAPVQDHGTLTGIADDDHPQYHNDARGDVRYSQLLHSHGNATPSAAGFMSSGDKSKVDGVAVAATANSPDAFLLARANHTGVQAIATVTGLQSALDALAFSGACVRRNGIEVYTLNGQVYFYTPDTEVFDVGGWWTAGVPTKLVVPAGVTYAEFGASLTVEYDGSAEKMLLFSYLYKNGSLLYRQVHRLIDTAYTAPRPYAVTLGFTSGPLMVAAADEFEFALSGSTEDVSNFQLKHGGASSDGWFWARKLG